MAFKTLRFGLFFILLLSTPTRAQSILTTDTRWLSVTGPQSIHAGQCNGPYTATMKNELNLTVNANALTIVQLVGATRGQFFADSACSQPVTSVSMASGLSSISFYFTGSAPGVAHVVARVSGTVHGALDVTVKARQFSVVTGQTASSLRIQSITGMNAPRSVTSDGTRVFVADTGNNRILVWNSFPASHGVQPDVAIGQPNLSTVFANNGGMNAKTLSGPSMALASGGKLFVSDTGNNRILIYNSIPTSSGAAADVVLGQAVWNEAFVNASGRSARTLNFPRDICIADSKLFVADTSNHRVLVWNSIPTSNYQPADFVLGQGSMSAGSANAGAAVSDSGMNNPTGLACSATHLFVADSSNNRVLVFHPLPSAAATPTAIVGQLLSTTATANNSGIAVAGRLSTPTGVSWDGTYLWVSDQFNHRVLRFTGVPATAATATRVLGHPNFTPGSFNVPTISLGLRNPMSVFALSSGRVLVADMLNNRSLMWNASPTSDGQASNVAFGQSNLTGALIYGTAVVDASNLRSPASVAISGSRMVVTDTLNNRVLIYNSLPASSGMSADVVVGQSSMNDSFVNGCSACGTTVSTTGMNTPASALVVGGNLVVSDSTNHRVSVWSGIPSSNGAAASHVIGQSATNIGTANQGGRQSNRLFMPAGLATDGTRLLITDRMNCRVLVYNTLPLGNNASADRVLGQADGTTSTCTNGQSRLNSPAAVATDGTRIVVADTGNSRVVIWNSFPSADGANADVFLGRSNWTTGTNRGPTRDLSAVSGVWLAGGKLFVSDTGQHRILVWNSIPTVSDTPPSAVIGMESLASRWVNSVGDLSRMLVSPAGLWSSGSRLWIVDSGNNRVVETVVP